MSLQESEEFLDLSFSWAKQLKTQMSSIGFKESHIVMLLKYCKVILDETRSSEISDLKSIEVIKKKLS
jgi:hypothetical protein